MPRWPAVMCRVAGLRELRRNFHFLAGRDHQVVAGGPDFVVNQDLELDRVFRHARPAPGLGVHTDKRQSAFPVKPPPWPRMNTALPKPTSFLTSMVVTGALVPAVTGALVAVVTGALVAGALVCAVTGVLVTGALVVFGVTVGFSLGFRAAFTALLVIFIFSSVSFNGRRTVAPLCFPQAAFIPHHCCRRIVRPRGGFMAHPSQTGRKEPNHRPESPP